MELKVGHTYRAKKPRQVGNTIGGYFNDREIIGLTDTEVQYDTPSMIGNRDYPRPVGAMGVTINPSRVTGGSSGSITTRSK